MSKYLDDLKSQLKGKNIGAFTKELQASANISKILKDQHQDKLKSIVKKDIQRLLKR